MLVIDSAHKQYFIAAGQVGVAGADQAIPDFRFVARSLRVVE
jgi:hypothetical protein